MPTDWTASIVKTPITGPRYAAQVTDASKVQAAALKAQAVATSHNTFRPDIYRVSEGYLN